MFVLVLLAMRLLAPSVGLAQQTGPVLIPELTDEDLARIDLHDGSVKDWLTVLGEPTLRPRDMEISIASSRQYHDPGDLDFRIWLGWHGASDRFYVALERADDIHVNRFDRSGGNISKTSIPVQDPIIYLSIDGGNTGEYPTPIGIDSGLPEFRLLANKRAQWYIVIGEIFDEGPHVIMQWLSSPPRNNWYDRPPYADGGGGTFGENPTISVVEFFVTPFDLLVWDDSAASRVSDLEAGKVISFHLYVIDIDNENGIAAEIGYWISPGEGLLVESLPSREIAATPGGIEALEEASWGQLKTVSNEAEKPIIPGR
jgi:hypothetical protein